MIFLLRLGLRNLARHARRSLLIAGLIAVGSAFLLFANALFAGTDRGLEEAFRRGFTGDFALAAESGQAFGLFGSEIPIVSEYESIPSLSSFDVLRDAVEGMPEIEVVSPVVSVSAQLSVRGFRVAVPVFGVEPDSYFALCDAITILSGDPADLGRGGIFLNEALASAVEAKRKQALKEGEALTFSLPAGSTFRIRKGFYAGRFSYAARTEALDRVVLADPDLVRGLAGYTRGFSAATDAPGSEAPGGAEASFDLDSLFSQAADVSAGSTGVELSDLEARLRDTTERDSAVAVSSAAWSFLLVRGRPGGERETYARLNAFASSRGGEVRVLTWREAAGSSATAVFAVQAVFMIGMGFLALGALLVMTSALSMAVLERVPEIGTMRGLGASRGFVASLLLAESLTLCLGGALAGMAIGSIAALLTGEIGIRLENRLLRVLFGGEVLRPFLSLSSVILQALMATFVGALAWVYPLLLALRIAPAGAMNRGAS